MSLLKLARDAGKGVMAVYEATSPGDPAAVGAVSYKSDGSPVTIADLTAHQIIVDGLSQIRPDIPVVSEECQASMPHRTSHGAFWLIDPLDGTKEFISRNGEFTINIALIENGSVAFGIVFAPSLGLLYWGGRGMGAFREQDGVVEKIIVDRRLDSAKPLRVVASRSHMDAETQKYIQQLGECELIQAGSSLKFCRVAEGSADVYPRLGLTCEWDTAAAQAILEAAGGQVCDLDGNILKYGKAEVLNPHFVATGVLPGSSMHHD